MEQSARRRKTKAAGRILDGRQLVGRRRACPGLDHHVGTGPSSLRQVTQGLAPLSGATTGSPRDPRARRTRSGLHPPGLRAPPPGSAERNTYAAGAELRGFPIRYRWIDVKLDG